MSTIRPTSTYRRLRPLLIRVLTLAVISQMMWLKLSGDESTEARYLFWVFLFFSVYAPVVIYLSTRRSQDPKQTQDYGLDGVYVVSGRAAFSMLHSLQSIKTKQSEYFVDVLRSYVSASQANFSPETRTASSGLIRTREKEIMALCKEMARLRETSQTVSYTRR